MRPKKVILLVNDDENELSITKFLLVTHGYRVLEAITGQEAIAIFSTAPMLDLVLTRGTMAPMNGAVLIGRLKRIRPHVPMILLSDAQATPGEVHMADPVLVRKSCSALELLGRIKVMTPRKRGPRKGAKHAAPELSTVST